jgi:NAD(P)-dependent dehydrogenase (short-subunit alcohol dehydrogenase family)
MPPTTPPPVVVITGASSGVGRAVARRFAADGALIGLLARGERALKATAVEVENLGGRALALPTDVSDADQVQAAADRVETELGPIDLWVNNAMTTVFGFFEDCTPEEFERSTRVTYLGTVWGTRTALGKMRPRDRGTIVQVGSALAYRGIPLQSAYCGAKHAINGLTESVRAELIHQGSSVHVGMVNLPAINTPQFSHCRSKFDRHPMPVPPIYQPEVAAEAVHLAYRERRREVNVALPTILTMAGNSLAPGLLDQYLGSSGVESQLDDRPRDQANVEGNLFEPVDVDLGAHGDFDSRSHGFSPALWLTRFRMPVAATIGLGALTWVLGRRD